MQDLFRFRHELSRLLNYAAAGFLMFTASLMAASPPQRHRIPQDFVQVFRSFLPEEILFLHTDLRNWACWNSKMEASWAFPLRGRAVSRDGGKT